MKDNMTDIYPKECFDVGVDLESFVYDVDRILDMSFPTIEKFQTTLFEVVRQYRISKTELEHEKCPTCKWKFKCLSGELKRPKDFFGGEFEAERDRVHEEATEQGEHNGYDAGYSAGYMKAHDEMRNEIYNDGYETGFERGKREAEENANKK